MQRQHVPQVAALERECFSDPWSEQSLAGELDNPLSLWLVCLADGEVCGYVGSQTVLGETDMMNVAVLPRARRQGIAQRLILELVARLKQQGSHCLSLEVRLSGGFAPPVWRCGAGNRLPEAYRSHLRSGR